MFKHIYLNLLFGFLGFFISFIFSLSANSFTTSFFRGIYSFFIFFIIAFVLIRLFVYAFSDNEEKNDYKKILIEQSHLNKNNDNGREEEKFEHLASLIKDQLKDK
jgi:uncharacterized protein YacL